MNTADQTLFVLNRACAASSSIDGNPSERDQREAMDHVRAALVAVERAYNTIWWTLEKLGYSKGSHVSPFSPLVGALVDEAAQLETILPTRDRFGNYIVPGISNYRVTLTSRGGRVAKTFQTRAGGCASALAHVEEESPYKNAVHAQVTGETEHARFRRKPGGPWKLYEV